MAKPRKTNPTGPAWAERPSRGLLLTGVAGVAAYLLLSKRTSPGSAPTEPGIGRISARMQDATPPTLTSAALVYITGALPHHAARYVDHLNRLMPLAGINTRLRLAHFLAQIAQESLSFEYAKEIASGRSYEGRADLGNTRKGDGVKFKGRGLIQVTGRGNYTLISKDLGIDYLNNPAWLERPEDAVRSALWYWERNKLNAVADSDNIRLVTRKINGGTAHLSKRTAFLTKAKRLLFTLGSTRAV